MENKVKDLDLLAAKTAQDIITQTAKPKNAGEVENLITKALGVLQENGVYAALLYLYSRSSNDRPIAESTRKNLLALLPKLGLGEAEGTDPKTALKFLTDNVCNNLDKLLLVKQVWEQTLIYARYGAKAREE